MRGLFKVSRPLQRLSIFLLRRIIGPLDLANIRKNPVRTIPSRLHLGDTWPYPQRQNALNVITGGDKVFTFEDCLNPESCKWKKHPMISLLLELVPVV